MEKAIELKAQAHAEKVWGPFYDHKNPDPAITKTQGEVSAEDFKAGNLVSNHTLKVYEFMTNFGQPIVESPAEMPKDRAELRLALLFEELHEYAKASGLLYKFEDLCQQASGEYEVLTQVEDDQPPFVEKVDLVEQLDALLDIQYILSGTVLENGFGKVFDDAFAEVHRSNMSKMCATNEEAERTIDKLAAEGVPAHFSYASFPTVVYRTSDLKVMKSIDYSPANLKQFISGTNG